MADAAHDDQRLAVGGNPRGAGDPLRGDAGRNEGGGTPGQPATIHGAEITTEGMPLSVTRGLGSGGHRLTAVHAEDGGALLNQKAGHVR